MSAQVDEAVRLYEEGWSLAWVGERIGVTARTVQLRLREAGVRMRDTHGRSSTVIAAIRGSCCPIYCNQALGLIELACCDVLTRR